MTKAAKAFQQRKDSKKSSDMKNILSVFIFFHFCMIGCQNCYFVNILKVNQVMESETCSKFLQSRFNVKVLFVSKFSCESRIGSEIEHLK